MANTINDLMAAVKRFVFNNTQGSDAFQGAYQGSGAASLAEFMDDAILRAANNARLFAERGHDFEAAKVAVSATISPGGSLSLDSVGGVKFRTLQAVVFDAGGDFLPLLLTTHRDLVVRKRVNMRLYGGERYPADGEEFSVGNLPFCAYTDGRILKLHPPQTDSWTLTLHGHKYLADYTKTGSGGGRAYAGSDFLLDNGFDFLQWQTIVELNYIVQIYVPRQEGSLAPPERQALAAWSNLTADDAYSNIGNHFSE